MKKVVTYVRNKNIRPSDYYRIVQYAEKMEAEVIVRSAIPKIIDRWSLDSRQGSPTRVVSLVLCYLFVLFNFLKGYIGDRIIKPHAVIVIREIFPRRMPPFFSWLLKKNCMRFAYIWDFDDSIIGTEISHQEAEIYYQCAKHIVVSTPYLKEHLPKSVWNKTSVLSTTDGDLAGICLEEVNAQRRITYEREINIVWVATVNNIPNLLDVLPYLDKAAEIVKRKYNKDIHLKVVCNAKIEEGCQHLIIDNITWSHDRALQEIMNGHIGIMPLMNNEFALGKAGFKLIQYIAGGLPIIASDTGFNSAILNEEIGFKVKQNSQDEWINAISSLSRDYDRWSAYSSRALLEWNKKYSFQEHLDFWNNLLNELV